MKKFFKRLWWRKDINPGKHEEKNGGNIKPIKLSLVNDQGKFVDQGVILIRKTQSMNDLDNYEEKPTIPKPKKKPAPAVPPPQIKTQIKEVKPERKQPQVPTATKEPNLEPSQENPSTNPSSFINKNVDRKAVSELVEASKVSSRRRKEGIISVVDTSDNAAELHFTEKDERTTELITKALLSNDFVRNVLNDEKIALIVKAMQPKLVNANTYIIKEGESGSHLFVSDEGRYDVVQKDRILKTFSKGEIFGELAILYRAKRFASIIATTDSKVWQLDRKVFQRIMVKSQKQEEAENIKFLTSVPDLKKIHPSNIIKLSQLLKRRFFPAGSVIIRQGDVGDIFYIIKGGNVTISKNEHGGPGRKVGELSRGDYFGEQALLKDDFRLATVTANPPGVECLTLERRHFIEYLGNLEELAKRDFSAMLPAPKKISTGQRNKMYEEIELEDLKLLGTLGAGAFGRVELHRYMKNESQTFALKKLKKYDMVMHQLETYAFNERNIMLMCNSTFICRLYKTYRDSKYLYFLMEPILGGDVWSTIQNSKGLDEDTSRFIAACVVEGLEYLHHRRIIYRDLKPENVMIDAKGYAKLVDFGYAKILQDTEKTYTFAGTPEYVAPEIILGNAHDRAVDYWTLGIFIYELLAGKPPFRGSNHVNTYSLIICGIDEIRFSSKISSMATSIIRKLCRPLPIQRLGYLRRGIKDIKSHKWFMDFDWKKLKSGKMKAPMIIPIAHDGDLSNFKTAQSFIEEETADPPDEFSGWDADF